MIVVIFELEPLEGRQDTYLDIAAELLPLAEQVEGFVSVERFRSLKHPEKLLSLSVFEDEAAVRRWRTLLAHRAAQRRGRDGIFRDYRLRVAKVLRDYGMHARDEAPADSRVVHEA